MDRFLEGLDTLLASCGIGLEKTAAADSPQRHDFPGRESVTAKEPPSPLERPAIKASDLPDGLAVSPVARAFGGKTAAEILVALRRSARDAALRKLGFARPEHRFLPFTESNIVNDARVMGFCLGALKVKKASGELVLPSTSLIPRTISDLTTGRGPEAALAAAGPPSLAAMRNTLLALTGLGGGAYAAKRALIDFPLHVGQLRTETSGQPFLARAPGTVSGFEAFPGGGALRP